MISQTGFCPRVKREKSWSQDEQHRFQDWGTFCAIFHLSAVCLLARLYQLLYHPCNLKDSIIESCAFCGIGVQPELQRSFLIFCTYITTEHIDRRIA